MARTHARVKGKSGSSKPAVADLSFVTMSAKEIEAKIVEMAKKDMTSSKIGLELRDSFGVPSVKKVTGKSVSEILEKNNLLVKIPEDLTALVVKANALKKHLKTNTRDTHNKRGLILIESKIRRLTKYYKKTARISADWSYN